MVAVLLSGERVQPVVGIASMLDGDELALAPAGVRAAVGLAPLVYVVSGEGALCGLADRLGRGLALLPGAVRVWWPGLAVGSDLGAHPLIGRIDDDDEAGMLAEFARRFDLSRPGVRQEIKLIEDARALLEHELATEREETRNLKIERHEALARAAKAEASLRAVTQKPEQISREQYRGES